MTKGGKSSIEAAYNYNNKDYVTTRDRKNVYLVRVPGPLTS